LRNPGVLASIPVLRELINGRISFVDSLTLICFSLYALALALDISDLLSMDNLFSFLSPTTESLLKLGMGGAIPLGYGHWWTLITATYLHGSVLHILFNLLWLRQIGPLAIELFGASRFFIIYTFAGLSGALVSALAGTPFFVGASGSIFGLFGALIYYGWHRGGTFGSTIFRQMLIWAAIGLVIGFMQPRVDNWGHIGGFIGGVTAAVALGYQERSRQSLGVHIGALVSILVVVLCFALQAIALLSG
jgi:rhomboid protease GluP